ncbi:hypothetical protein GCM10023321_54040 [Pseudonocardia eucalypti]|uniref:VWFA domain-containing protein n=1 Tax=Pseudonocardia eucalypti TaxID=648755 RepID=A0ABP9QP66_9PSEU|nr:Mg-chelatase subunit ChlD [Pseudonocardia eucalypti]
MSPSRYSVLATALGGRPLTVAPAPGGEVAYTDGQTIFVRPGGPVRAQVVVHALLVGNGSLNRRVLGELRGRPERAGRYLLLEMSRLCHPGGPWPQLAPLIGLPRDVPVPAGPSESLRLAGGGLPPVPADWGRIRPARLLRRPAEELDPAAPSRARTAGAPPELDDDDAEEPGRILRALASPLGSSALGRMLRDLLGMGRSRGKRSGSADAELAESGTDRPGAGARPVPGTSWRAAGGPALAGPVALGYRYPEWDGAAGRYRPGWCTVVERQPEPPDDDEPRAEVQGRDIAMRRRLARIGLSPQALPRQPVGDELDTDAMVRARVALAAGSSAEENVYLDARPRRRELSVLVLVDVSGSTKDPSPAGGSVFDRQREAAACLVDSLTALGARTAGYGFYSQGRHAVHLLRVKTFDEPWSGSAHERLARLRPGGYTRLGAAVRHGTMLLTRETSTARRRLLVVLSDGFPYDTEYQDAYAERDCVRALAEARHRAIGCLCVSIGAPTDDEALTRVFGSAAHAGVPDLDSLRAVAPVLFRHGLRTSDPRRRSTQLPAL